MLDVYSLQYLRERYKNNHMLKIGNIMRVRREMFQEKKKNHILLCRGTVQCHSSKMARAVELYLWTWFIWPFVYMFFFPIKLICIYRDPQNWGHSLQWPGPRHTSKPKPACPLLEHLSRTPNGHHDPPPPSCPRCSMIACLFWCSIHLALALGKSTPVLWGTAIPPIHGLLFLK